MNKTQYINAILKRILVTDRTKNRIRADLTTEIEALEEQGLSWAEIINQKGSPEALAKEFNASYSNTEMRRQYYLQKGLKIAGVIFFALAILLFLAGTFFVNPAFWYSPEAAGESLAVIGGADGPTQIFLTSVAHTAPIAFWLLAAGCVLLALCGVFWVLYGLLRKKY